MQIDKKGFESLRQLGILADSRHKKLFERIVNAPTRTRKRSDKVHSNNTKGFIGIYKAKGRTRYQSSISVHGRKVHLGSSASAHEAARKYDVAALAYFGEAALLNFPRSDYEVSA